MKIVTSEQMRELDRCAIEDYGIPGLLLMESAGQRVAGAAKEMLSPMRLPHHVVIVCGRGNNGGDGFVAGRHLVRDGVFVEIWALAREEDYRGDAAVNFKILKNSMSVSLKHILEEDDLQGFRAALLRADLVVDAILGTGIKRKVKALFAAVINHINAAEIPVLSVDIPSGVDADDGHICGAAIRAQQTVTFAFPKRGFFLFPGASCVGKLRIVDIGIPETLAAESDLNLNMITASLVKENLLPRPLDGHKGTFGRVLVVAGSPGMTGAAALTANAALKGAAGLVYVATAESLRPVLEAKLMEPIAIGLPELSKEQCISRCAVPEILRILKRCTALAIGPGLAHAQETFSLLQELLRLSPVPMVIDAGALTALSQDPALLREASHTPVVTPHPGEMAELCGLTLEEVQKQRLTLAAQKAVEWGAIVVLKGAYSVVALPTKEVYINPVANPVMATAGTGDILTGLIVSQLAQDQPPSLAALCGTYIHGYAGELAAEVYGEQGVTAQQIAEQIPAVFSRIKNMRR